MARVGSRASEFARAGASVGKITSPLVLAVVAGTGNLVQPPGTSVAALPAQSISSIRTITISGDPAVAPERYRFWSLRGVPYLLVCDAEAEPPIILCFLHQSRDLPDGA